MAKRADQFVEALHALERDRNVEQIAALFADDAVVSNPLVKHGDGRQGAAAFWETYRGNFEEIESTFRHVTETDGVAFLEWTSKGAIDGQPFAYEGVSVLEMVGDRITAFRTYFDPRQVRVTDR